MTRRTRYVDTGTLDEILARLKLVQTEMVTLRSGRRTTEVVVALNTNAIRSVPAEIVEKWVRKSLVDEILATVLAEKMRLRVRN